MIHGWRSGSDPILTVPAAGPEVWIGAGPAMGGTFEQRHLAVRSLIVLFLVAGCSAALTAVLSAGPNHLTRGLLLVATFDVATAAVAACWSRARWSRVALLAMGVPALGIYAYADYLTGDPYFAGGYLFIIAVWVGIAEPQWVNLALAPLYALAYWLPFAVQPHGPALDHSVLSTVTVAVAGGETVAWLSARLASVSARLRGQDQLRFAALDGESSDVTAVLDATGTLTYVSASVEAIFGYRAEALRGVHVDEIMARIVYPDDLVGAASTLEAAMTTPRSEVTFVARIRHRNKTWRHVEVKVRNLLDDGAVGSVLVDFWDVTDRVESRIQLEASEESFRLLFQLSPLPTIVVDPATLRCLRVNDAACAHYGYSHDEFLAMTVADLLPGRGPRPHPDSDDPPPGGFLRPGLWQHMTSDGRLIDVEISVTRTQFAGVGATTMIVVDVTDQRALEAQLRHLALHDTTTGLANRALLEDRLDRALAASTRAAQSVAVLFCDLDGFQSVHASLGPDAGDAVLRTVAARLREVVRPGDTVARFGSTEFAVIVELANETGIATALADRIIASLAQTVSLEVHQVDLSVSVGIAFGRSTSNADELCRNAVAASRQAKASGKNCYRIFEASMRSTALRRLELTGDLRAGLDQGQFRLQYQPHVALASGQVEGLEALIRWHHPVHGVIPPLDFVPLAEESGLIVPLGRWILEEACRQAVTWPMVASGPASVAVNLSVRQLRSMSIVDDVRAALALSGLDPTRLVLEITESIIMEDTTSTVSLFKELKALGVRLSIDDFGTGYSSLSYLQRFDFDVLKIDKSFVDGMTELPEQSAAFIRTIVTLGHTLGMHIITEGIETAEQYRALVRLGSDAGQGYLVSRPIDADAVADFIVLPARDYSVSAPAE